MKKLCIGLDLDGVICDYYPELVSNLQKEIDPKITLTDLTQYNIASLFGWSAEKSEEFFDKDQERETFLKVKPIQGAVEAIKELYSQGHEIYLVTSRNPYMHGMHTADWLVEQQLPYTALIFCKDKVPAAKNLEMDLFVDDDPGQISRMKEEGIRAMLYDQPVNRSYRGLKRVNSWAEIIKFVTRYANENFAPSPTRFALHVR